MKMISGMVKATAILLLLSAAAFSQALQDRQWSNTQGIADRWAFANIFGGQEEIYVTHRNNGQLYATEVYQDGTRRNYAWTNGPEIHMVIFPPSQIPVPAERWKFSDVFGTGAKYFVTHNNSGQIQVAQLHPDGTLQKWAFNGGYGIGDRWDFANVLGKPHQQQQYVTHQDNGNMYVTQVNQNGGIQNTLFSNTHGIADRWAFAKVFSPDKDVYVTHRNNGTFYTTELFENGTAVKKTMIGVGIADRWAFANVFGTGRQLYVTHRNNGQFYATQLDANGTAKNWQWNGGYGIGDRWGFTDFYGTGRDVYVTQKNDGSFYVTQLNEDGTLQNRIWHGHGIADRWAFADVYGNGKKAYVTHRSEGKMYASEPE